MVDSSTFPDECAFHYNLKGDYKYIEFSGDRVDADTSYIPGYRDELYDLGKDIGETNNLVESDPEIAKHMKEERHDWLEGLGARVSTANPRHEVGEGFSMTNEIPEWLRGADGTRDSRPYSQRNLIGRCSAGDNGEASDFSLGTPAHGVSCA